MNKTNIILIMLVVLSTMTLAATSDGLYSYIKFENSTLVDEYGYANEWSVYNSPSFVTGKLGNAIYFDPNTEDIVVYYGTGDPLSPDNIYESQWKHNGGTFNVWFNIDSFTSDPNNWGFIYGGRQEDYVGCTNGEPMGVSLSIGNVDVQSNAFIDFTSWDPDWPANKLQFTNIMLGELQTDTWYMATTTYDASSHIAKLYIDGVEIANATYTPSEAGKDNYCSWYFGNGPNNGIDGGNNYAFPGAVDAFKVFDRSLSGAEVLEIYTAENAGLDVPWTPPCTPDWSCDGYDSCLTNDTRVCNSVEDLNTCGEVYGGDYTEFSTQACDYCTPDWSCLTFGGLCDQFKANCTVSSDSNSCYTATGLTSDQYAGNYSEFGTQTCGTTSASTGAAHQSIITPPQQQSSQNTQGQTFSVAPLENARISILQWFNSAIMWIRKAVGMES